MAETDNNKEQLRTEASSLLAELRAQLSEVEHALGAHSGDGALYSQLSAAASQLSGAASELSVALSSKSFPLRAADLRALASIAHSGSTAALVTEATSQAQSAAARVQAVTASAVETRRETETLSHDVFDRRVFDRYLHFSSPVDEAEYRKREADAKKYVDAQLAKKTPEGDLNAGGGMIGQMLDAHTHGAGASPEFLPKFNALAEKTEHQREAMHAAGQSTEEYDHRLDTNVRAYLKAQQLSDAEIDARIKAAARPLDVLTPYLNRSRAAQKREEHVGVSADTARNTLPAAEAVTPDTVSPVPAENHLEAIRAKLKAAGVQMSDSANSGDGHGLSGLTKPPVADRSPST